MVAAVAAVRWSGSGERSFLDGHVCVEVDLGGLYADVTEPQGDDSEVDAGVKQAHRGGVAQHVSGDLFITQGWAVVYC